MLLQIENLTKHIDGRLLLNNISFAVGEGEVVALCGPSGAGKSTLIRILAGLSPFESGTIQVGEHRFEAGIPYPKLLRGSVGVVFQHHNLFPHLTALANVMLALRKVRNMSRSDAANRAHSELDRMGLTTQATQYPCSLSGGERQRVAIARALAMDPLVLLLDEPTSGLDPMLMGDVLRAIQRLAGSGMSMLLVTHNLPFARGIADRFAVLQNSDLICSKNVNVLDALEGDWSSGS